MNNKIVFLDVDGVLNNGTWAEEMYEQGVRVYHDDILHEPSLAQLRRIVDETGAVIVVSSSWRQITVGHYEQDADPSNGAEPIEWIVLENSGKTAMLISKYGLDAKP